MRCTDLWVTTKDSEEKKTITGRNQRHSYHQLKLNKVPHAPSLLSKNRLWNIHTVKSSFRSATLQLPIIRYVTIRYVTSLRHGLLAWTSVHPHVHLIYSGYLQNRKPPGQPKSPAQWENLCRSFWWNWHAHSQQNTGGDGAGWGGKGGAKAGRNKIFTKHNLGWVTDNEEGGVAAA